jgi:L-malate glycosyltransferase
MNFYQLSDRIKIMGYVNDVRSIWAENHILLLPSRGEGTPLALIEAMICGRPSVVTDIGGNSEWIAEGKTGFVAEAPTTRSINAALNRAWQTQDKWQSIGKSAHESAMSELDLYPEKTLLGLLTQQYKYSTS